MTLLTIVGPLLVALSRPLRRTPAPPLVVDREVTWSNPQGAPLTAIADDVWLAERPFYPRLPGLQSTDVGCKAVIIRLPDGKLWVHAPVGLDDAMRHTLAELGPVAHIVTPNTEHQQVRAVRWCCAAAKGAAASAAAGAASSGHAACTDPILLLQCVLVTVCALLDPRVPRGDVVGVPWLAREEA